MKFGGDSEHIKHTIIDFFQRYGLMLAVGAAILIALILLIVVIVVVCKKKKDKAQAGNDYAGLDQQLRNQRFYNGGTPQGYPQMQVNVQPQVNVPPQANMQPQPYPYVQVNMQPQALSSVSGNAQPQGASASPANKYTPMTGNGQPAGVMAGLTNPIPEKEKTQLLFGQPASSEHKVTLTNMADPGKIYACRILDKIVIGRNPACCDIAIPTDNAVSERHCEISYTDNRFYIRDTGSSNGTSINGCIVGSVTQIRPGDMVKIGRAEYRITLE